VAKRLRDTEIWNKQWYRELKPKYKCFIDYLFDKCDHAGLWEVDKSLMEFYVNDRFKENLNELLDKFKKHIIEISQTKWFLIDFIPFQYKCQIEELNPKNKLHKSIIDLLTKYNIYSKLKELKQGAKKGLSIPSKGDKDKDKDKDPDKDPVKDKEKERYLEYVLLTKKENQKLLSLYGETLTNKYMEDLNGWIHQIGVKKADIKYKSHYHTILNWLRRDGHKPQTPVKEYKTPKIEGRTGETQRDVEKLITKITGKKRRSYVKRVN